MVADFLISHQEVHDKDSELYLELEAVAVTVYMCGHLMPSYCCSLIVTIQQLEVIQYDAIVFEIEVKLTNIT
jgi:hypothetical protein